MATQTLVDVDVKLGEEAYLALKDDAVLGLTAALWWYDTEASEWRLVIGARDYDRRGPQAAYLRLRILLKKAKLLDRLPLSRIVAKSPRDPLFSSMASRFKEAPPAHIAIYDLMWGALPVAGAYLYQVTASN